MLGEFERRLTQEERDILRLRRDHMQWQEIADRLANGSGPEALRKRFERAVARVSKELGLDQ